MKALHSFGEKSVAVGESFISSERLQIHRTHRSCRSHVVARRRFDDNTGSGRIPFGQDEADSERQNDGAEGCHGDQSPAQSQVLDILECVFRGIVVPGFMPGCNCACS
jgi:hypothetical protein